MLFPVTARQLDLGLFGLTVDGQYMAHALYLDGAGLANDGIHHQLFHLTIFRRNLNLDQLVVVQRQIDLGQHPSVRPCCPSRTTGFRLMGQALEVLFLFIVENHGNFFISQG